MINLKETMSIYIYNFSKALIHNVLLFIYLSYQNFAQLLQPDFLSSAYI